LPCSATQVTTIATVIQNLLQPVRDITPLHSAQNDGRPFLVTQVHARGGALRSRRFPGISSCQPVSAKRSSLLFEQPLAQSTAGAVGDWLLRIRPEVCYTHPLGTCQADSGSKLSSSP